jgi:hypothetical protein
MRSNGRNEAKSNSTHCELGPNTKRKDCLNEERNNETIHMATYTSSRQERKRECALASSIAFKFDLVGSLIENTIANEIKRIGPHHLL